MSSQIAVGTAQFGMPYGVANRSGQVGVREAAAILRIAADAGIDTIDTAMAYGDAEARLGAVGVKGWRVITKLPAVPSGCADVRRWVRESVAASLSRLRVAVLGGVLLHRAADAVGAEAGAVRDALRELKQEGMIEKIGVSIYAPADLEPMFGDGLVDIVQAPVNLLDQRLEQSGWLARLVAAGVEVHSRSAFLQGVLLLPAPSRPAYFARWPVVWKRYEQWLERYTLTPLQACVSYALSRPGVSRVVIGADTPSQLNEVLAVAASPVMNGSIEDVTGLACDDPYLIDPSRWMLN